jgi:hypothetical protein
MEDIEDKEVEKPEPEKVAPRILSPLETEEAKEYGCIF